MARVRLEEDNEILRRALVFFAGELGPPQSLIVAFIDELRVEGHAVESICRVLREQCCQIAARTYRDWARTNRPVAARTVTDAMVTNQGALPPELGHRG